MPNVPDRLSPDQAQTAPKKPDSQSQWINTAADQCVKCGLCLPHCPTYELFRNEADSPRGRIALMQGLSQSSLAPEPVLIKHLDRCLGCGSCEKVCPSNVQYGQLLDRTKSQLEPSRQRGWRQAVFRRAGLYLASRPRLWRSSWRLLRLYQRSGLQTFIRHTGLLKPLGLATIEKQLPPVKVNIGPRRITANQHPPLQKQVGLFTGCMETVFSATIINDTTRLLRALGYQVIIPANQTCCGAIHQHNGATQDAQRLGYQNNMAFNTAATTLYLSSGCGAQLESQLEPQLKAHIKTRQTSANADTDTRYIEATRFLSEQQAHQYLTFKPLNESVYWFSPCSQRNVTGGEDTSLNLIRLIPEIEIVTLNAACCGAAGTYMLSQPDIANRLGDNLLANIEAAKARYLVTANVGCAIHLSNRLREQGQSIEVIHPLTLLARQLLQH